MPRPRTCWSPGARRHSESSPGTSPRSSFLVDLPAAVGLVPEDLDPAPVLTGREHPRQLGESADRVVVHLGAKVQNDVAALDDDHRAGGLVRLLATAGRGEPAAQ